MGGGVRRIFPMDFLMGNQGFHYHTLTFRNTSSGELSAAHYETKDPSTLAHGCKTQKVIQRDGSSPSWELMGKFRRPHFNIPDKICNWEGG